MNRERAKEWAIMDKQQIEQLPAKNTGCKRYFQSMLRFEVSRGDPMDVISVYRQFIKECKHA